MGALLVAEFEIELVSGYSFTAELSRGYSPFREGPWAVTVRFGQAGGSASGGLALSDIAKPDFPGRLADGALNFLWATPAHADKGDYRLEPGEAAAFWAWLREHVDGLAALGPRSRPSALAA